MSLSLLSDRAENLHREEAHSAVPSQTVALSRRHAFAAEAVEERVNIFR